MSREHGWLTVLVLLCLFFSFIWLRAKSHARQAQEELETVKSELKHAKQMVVSFSETLIARQKQVAELESHIGPPNLDGMSAADLYKLWQTYTLLQLYCKCKAEAMDRRLAGEIDQALRLEAQCDGYYKQLPEDWRW